MSSTETRSRTLDIGGGVRLAYRETGDPAGTPVLLLHGMSSSAASWDAFAAELADAGFRAIALDQRGHGGSSRAVSYSLHQFRDDAAAFLDRAGLEQVDVVGHSLGGHVGTMLAQVQPQRIRRLVLEDIPVRPRDAAENGRASPFSLVGLLLAQLGNLGKLKGFDRRLVRPIITELRTPDPQWWTALRRVTMPTLVISGGPASHVPAERLRDLTLALPDADLVTIDAGHRVHSLRPKDFSAAVLPFLES
ncbi:alpha/beta fold hydrolase [Flindersiella endophytica]